MIDSAGLLIGTTAAIERWSSNALPISGAASHSVLCSVEPDMLIRSLFCRPRRSARRSFSDVRSSTGMENLETRALLSAVTGVSADAIASAEPAPMCEITDPNSPSRTGRRR